MNHNANIYIISAHSKYFAKIFLCINNKAVEESVRDRILKFIDHKGISSSEFSKRIGVSRNYILVLRHELPNVMHARLAERIALGRLDRLGRYIELLLIGKGDMLIGAVPDHDKNEDFFEKKLLEFFQRRDEQYQHILSQNSEIIRQNGEILKRVLESQNKDR